MKEQDLQIFLDIISNYFNQLGVEELVIDTAYLLKGNKPKIFDYTSIITISGARSGVVHFSATRELLYSILKNMGETDSSEAIYLDLTGEVANTIAGNARKAFGSEFNISVPSVSNSSLTNRLLANEERSFIIPITWLSQVGEILVFLQD